MWGLTFEIPLVNHFGNSRMVELKPGGAKVDVTNDNAKEFVNLYVEELLENSIKSVYKAFESGFKGVVSSKAFYMCRPEEVEQLICGEQELDFDLLEQNTTYEGYEEDSEVIKYVDYNHATHPLETFGKSSTNSIWRTRRSSSFLQRDPTEARSVDSVSWIW